ncbi:hypothetical protein UFOVP609_26 [uncultured Caudovirales phage]|uniref:Uncharacterized protein n=1 Tax=uncultured Caudovirales phage TaxID=2100421 RepID=A0A6J5N6B7_9CAUD|nr:hypothetical protein UFOVP609_26 [uncultured Caudovirales phage]
MAHARLTDPQTSHEAARSVENITATQTAILKLLAGFPMTDEELVWHYEQNVRMGADARDFPRASASGIRSRRAELVKLGYVFDSGHRTKISSGRNAIIWRA